MKQYGLSLALAVGALLIAALTWLWVDPQGRLRNVAWQPPAPLAPDLGGEQTPRLPAAQAMDTGMFVATLDRPLFSPSRRPAPKAGAEVAKVEEVDPFAGIHLYGLYTAANDTVGVLVRIEGKTRRLASGDALGGWTLKSVQDRQVTFVRDGQERTLNLAIARPGVPAPAATKTQAPTIAATSAAAPAAGPNDAQAQREEAQRERLRLRNEARIKAGAKLLSE